MSWTKAMTSPTPLTRPSLLPLPDIEHPLVDSDPAAVVELENRIRAKSGGVRSEDAVVRAQPLGGTSSVADEIAVALHEQGIHQDVRELRGLGEGRVPIPIVANQAVIALQHE